MNEYTIKPDEMVIAADSLDCLTWDRARRHHEGVAKAFPDRAAHVVGADLFASLYKAIPTIRDDAPDAPRAKFITQLQESADHMRLRGSTRFDEMLSAAAATTLKERLEEQETTRQALDNIERGEALRERLNALSEVSEGLSEGSDELGKISHVIQETAQELSTIENETLEMLDGPGMVKSIRRSVKATNEDIEEAMTIASGWGNEPGIKERMLLNPDLRRLLTSAKLKAILRIAGRMKDAVSAQRAKRPQRGPQRVDIECGNDLSRVDPYSLVMLRHPKLKALFLKKYTEKTLLQRRFDERPRQNRGPFIVVIDESGSMSGPREEWAKALAIALCGQAHSEKRKFGCIAFGMAQEIRKTFNPNPEETLEWMSEFLNSRGTHFERPLDEGLQMIENDAPDADIILISDGACDVGDQWLVEFKERAKKAGVKVIGIQVGDESLSTIRKIADIAFRIDITSGNNDNLESLIQEMK